MTRAVPTLAAVATAALLGVGLGVAPAGADPLPQDLGGGVAQGFDNEGVEAGAGALEEFVDDTKTSVDAVGRSAARDTAATNTDGVAEGATEDVEPEGIDAINGANVDASPVPSADPGTTNVPAAEGSSVRRQFDAVGSTLSGGAGQLMAAGAAYND